MDTGRRAWFFGRNSHGGFSSVGAVFVAVAALAAPALFMGGCSKSNYGVDLRNRTPQPVYAQLVERMNSGEQRARVGARLGPGDRAGVGPVRARTGSVTLIVDTMPNPGVPAMVDLAPGTSSIEVTQEGEGTSGPIRLRELR